MNKFLGNAAKMLNGADLVIGSKVRAKGVPAILISLTFLVGSENVVAALLG